MISKVQQKISQFSASEVTTLQRYKNTEPNESVFSLLWRLKRDTARLCCWAPAVQQSIKISFLPGPQQQTHRTLL